jgi:hypothetical protein
MPPKKEAKPAAPQWFYYISVSAAFLFTFYISIYSAIHFEDMMYMNIVVVFLSITLVSFFLISAVYFQSERMGWHVFSPVAFFAGIAGLVIYAYKATDATSIVRYSIIYTIIVAGLSLFAMLPKKILDSKSRKQKK